MTFKQRTFRRVLLVLFLSLGGFLLLADEPPATNKPRSPEGPPAKTFPTLRIEAIYPGANAQTLVDTVASPIEQQINGLEKVRYLYSRCTNDGKYTLLVSFAPGVDLDINQILVQNRVSLALPVIPAAVQDQGITIRKHSSGAFLFVTLYSPDASKDTLYLSRYASIQIRDELQRLPNMADVTLFDEQDYALQIWLDPQRLAALSLTAEDVSKALDNQNVRMRPAPLGQPFRYTVPTLGRLVDAEDFGAVIVKTGAHGGFVRLKDVARVELGGVSKGETRLDGKPVVVFGLSANSQANERKLRAAVRKRMEELKKAFPPGIDYTLAFDLTPNPDTEERQASPSYLLAEPILPTGVSTKRAQVILERYSAILREIKGVQHVLSLPENPFDRFPGGPCLVASFAPNTSDAARERLARDVRRQLEKVEEAELRLRDLSRTGDLRPVGFPVDLLLRGPETEAVQAFGERLAERLQRTGKLTDLSSAPQEVPQFSVEIDRTKAAALGVAVGDISNVLEVYLGSGHVGDIKQFGRTWKVQVQIDGRPADRMADIKQLMVRNDKGQMISLATLAVLRETVGPIYLDRFDFQSADLISANPAPGVSLAEARWLCEKLAEEVRKELRLSTEYRLVWMKELPAAKPLPDELKDVEPPPLEVAVSKPVVREVTDYADFTGRCEAVEMVALRARVTGFVTRMPFEEGSNVKKGDLLFEIDPRPYQAQLDQAMSQVALHDASLKLAQATYERDLASARINKDSVSQQQIDHDKAAVEEAKARLDASKSSVEIHKLNLEFTKVTSPIDGRIGRYHLTRGNLINQDQTLLATVVSLDPIHVYFDVDESTFLKLKTLGDKEVPVLVGLTGEEGYPRKGKVNFVDSQVNRETATLSIRAVLPNRDHSLLPGMFARVRLPLGTPHKALLVPDEAIRSDQGRKVLYLVDEQNKVVSRPVVVGPLHDGLRIIEKGLQPDERFIDGGKKVRPGMTVKPIKSDTKR